MKFEISEDIVYDFVEKHEGLSMHARLFKWLWMQEKNPK